MVMSGPILCCGVGLGLGEGPTPRPNIVVTAAAASNADEPPAAPAPGAPLVGSNSGFFSFTTITGRGDAELSKWTLRFLKRKGGRRGRRASAEATDAAELERRYAAQCARDAAGRARVAAALMLLVNAVTFLSLPKDARFGLYPLLQLLVAAPFEVALFAASFSRPGFPRLFEPLVSLVVICFSLSQRFLFELLVVYNVTGERCAYHAPIICVAMLWVTCTFLDMRFHVSAIVSLVLVLESFLPIPFVLALGLPGAPCLALDQHGTCALSGLLAVGASYLRERGERRLFLQEQVPGRAESPPPDVPSSRRPGPAPPRAEECPPADEERPAERASLSGAGALPPPGDVHPAPAEAPARRLTDASSASSHFADLLRARLSPSALSTEWAAREPGPGTPSSQDPLMGAPESDGGGSPPPGALPLPRRGRLRRALRWLAAGSLFPDPDTERAFQAFYSSRAWARMRVLSVPLLALYICSLAASMSLAAGRLGVSLVAYARSRQPDSILELFTCGLLFLLGTAVLYWRPPRLVPHVTYLSGGACLAGQLAALTSLRRLEALAAYNVEAWPKISLYMTFNFISSAFWVPTRPFFFLSCVSFPYGVYALSPRDPFLSGRIVDLFGFVLFPVLAVFFACRRQEQKLRRLFLLTRAENAGVVPGVPLAAAMAPATPASARSFALGGPSVRVAPA